MNGTGECRGCEGIQVITPQPIFNRAGLEQLRYRVGNHPAFFETMLARISEIERQPENPEASSVAARALERLTTRKPDDPSIALLDAWAAVASILSFYQERIANEAFLRTATERRSVEELARLVGYDLRPGLASSVLLAFEVDDQSDDVLIPKGTPAKSTPVPGSNTQPQTFETSENFTAHPRWNLIRPRLTRPIDALLTRSQLYFQGTGLRIRPNDLLAVAEKAGDDPISINVLSVREINSVERPTTIVTVKTDRIVDEVADKSNEFLEGAARTLFTSKYRDGLENRFRNHLTKARRSLREQRLEGADSVLELELVRQDLLGESPLSGSTDNMLSEADEMARWYDEPGKLQTFALDAPAYKDHRSFYVQLHRDAKATADAWKSALDDLLSASDQHAVRVAKTWKSLWSAALVDPAENKPFVHLGLQPISLAAAATTVICPQPHTVNGDTSTVMQVLVEGRSTGEVMLDLGTHVNVPTPAMLAAKVQEAVAQVKLQAVNGDYNFAYLKVIGQPGNVPLAVGIQPFRNADATQRPTNFEDLEYDKAVLVPGDDTDPHIDPDFQLATSATTNYRIAASVVVGGATIRKKDGSAWTGTTKQAKDIDDEITSLVLANITDRPRGRIVVLFEFLPELPANAPPVAFALRTVVFRGAASSKEVRGRVGRFLGELSRHAPHIAALETYRTGLNDQVINGFQAIIAPADTPSDERQISVLMADSAAAEFEGIRHELLSQPDADFRRDKLEVAWDTWRQDSGADQSDMGTLVAHENAALSRGAITFIRDKLQGDDLPNTLPLIVDNAPLAAAKHFDTSLTDIHKELETQQGKYSGLTNTQDGPVNKLAKGIMGVLHKRRDEFVKELDEFQKEPMKNYGPATSTPANTAKNLIEDQFNATPDTTAVARLAKLKTDWLADANAITAGQIKGNDTSVAALVSVFDGNITKIENLRVSLSSTQSEITNEIIDGWRDILDLYRGQVQTPGDQDSLDNQQDLLQRLAAAGGGLGALTPRDLTLLFSGASNLWAQIQATLKPEDKSRLYDQMRRFRNRKGLQPYVYTYRAHTNLYGWNSAGIQKTELLPGEREVPATATVPAKPEIHPTTRTIPNRIDPLLNVGTGELQEDKRRLFLDGDFQQTKANTFVAIQKTPPEQPKSHQILEVKTFPRTDYGLSGNTTRVVVVDENGWWEPQSGARGTDTFSVLRQARVWCDAEQLPLAEVLLVEEPETKVLPRLRAIELDEVYPELSTQTKLVLEGVRFDEEVGAPGEVFEREAIDVVGVVHTFDKTLYRDRIVTHITLARPLANAYWRSTVRIHANVVEATHGQSYDQVLGSGDGRSAFQRFNLNNSPLTRLPAATPRGSEDQLVVRVNGVRWDQADHIAAAQAQEAAYEVGQDRVGNPQIQFGDGERGARLPSGSENVRSRYRAGLGTAGNVDADLINQMSQPPLGARSVRNPLRASGGTDEDSLEQARLRAGRATMSLDKLVSLADYRNFALFFAGIDKVEARRESGKIRLTVASTAPEPLLESGALLRNLRKALRDHGDPTVVVVLEPHEPLLLFIAADVAIDPSYEWDAVEAQIRARLLDRFSYRRSEFGQDILAANVLSAIQGIEGVTFVDLNDLRTLQSSSGSSGSNGYTPLPNPRLPVGPDQLCFLDPEVPDMLILEQTS